MSALDERIKTGMTQEGMLRLGNLGRLENESTLDYLRRQKVAILAAREADTKANREAFQADALRKEIRALGHEPGA